MISSRLDRVKSFLALDPSTTFTFLTLLSLSLSLFLYYMHRSLVLTPLLLSGDKFYPWWKRLKFFSRAGRLIFLLSPVTTTDLPDLHCLRKETILSLENFEKVFRCFPFVSPLGRRNRDLNRVSIFLISGGKRGPLDEIELLIKSRCFHHSSLSSYPR